MTITAKVDPRTKGGRTELRFGEYSARWLSIKQKTVATNTYLGYAQAVNRLNSIFARRCLCKVTVCDMKAFVADMSEFSRSTVSKTLITAEQIFESAKVERIITENPCLGVKATGKRTETRDALTRSQAAELTKTAYQIDKRLGLFCDLALLCGVRREEIIGLQWDAIRLSGDDGVIVPYIEVKRVVTKVGNTHALTADLKSRSAARKIPLVSKLADALKVDRESRTSDFILASDKGGFYPVFLFNQHWSLLMDALDFHATAHVLRHTYISELCAKGVDIAKIQYLAGHSSPQVTLKVYTHVRDNRPEDMAELIEAAIG